MGDLIEVQDVQAENGGTLIQIDTDRGRIFVETRAILKALNNYLYTNWEHTQIKQYGMEKIDPSSPPEGLID